VTVSRRIQHAQTPRSAFAQKLKMLLLLNALPLAAVAFLAWKLWRGTLTLEAMKARLPAGAGDNLLAFALVLLALIVVASFLLPIVSFGVRMLRLRHLLAVERWRTGRAVRRGWEVLWFLPRTLTYAVLWSLRLISMLATLALSVAAMVFVVRLIKPDFGEAWLPIGRWIELFR
jgi:hypothetical protein